MKAATGEEVTAEELGGGAVHTGLSGVADHLANDDADGNDPLNSNLQSEQVSVFNITACKPEMIELIDNFPGTRFEPVGFQTRVMPDFDWDGYNQFTFNTARRNDAWGEFYIYNYETHKSTLVYPIKNICCYRDIRWSPDGTYVLFAFQDQGLGPQTQNLLYFVPAGQLETVANFQPIPLPEGFFKNPKEGPQPALRPAQP